MATLAAWRFDNAEGAEHATKTLRGLTDQGLVTVEDAALVRWDNGARRPMTEQLNTVVGMGAFGDVFWGMLLGILFYLPLLGAAVGAANSAVSESLAYVGVDDSFVNRVRDEIHPGTSALFVIAADQAIDPVNDAFLVLHRPALLLTRLAPEHEAAVRVVFSG
jgi:uncharacterized membrane protein